MSERERERESGRVREREEDVFFAGHKVNIKTGNGSHGGAKTANRHS